MNQTYANEGNALLSKLHDTTKLACQLAEALERARQDTNWMLNNHLFLNPSVFEYMDVALDAAREAGLLK